MIFEDISIEEFVTIRGEEQFEEGYKEGSRAGEERASEEKAFREELIKQYGL